MCPPLKGPLAEAASASKRATLRRAPLLRRLMYSVRSMPLWQLAVQCAFVFLHAAILLMTFTHAAAGDSANGKERSQPDFRSHSNPGGGASEPTLTQSRQGGDRGGKNEIAPPRTSVTRGIPLPEWRRCTVAARASLGHNAPAVATHNDSSTAAAITRGLLGPRGHSRLGRHGRGGGREGDGELNDADHHRGDDLAGQLCSTIFPLHVFFIYSVGTLLLCIVWQCFSGYVALWKLLCVLVELWWFASFGDPFGLLLSSSFARSSSDLSGAASSGSTDLNIRLFGELSFRHLFHCLTVAPLPTCFILVLLIQVVTGLDAIAVAVMGVVPFRLGSGFNYCPLCEDHWIIESLKKEHDCAAGEPHVGGSSSGPTGSVASAQPLIPQRDDAVGRRQTTASATATLTKQQQEGEQATRAAIVHRSYGTLPQQPPPRSSSFSSSFSATAAHRVVVMSSIHIDPDQASWWSRLTFSWLGPYVKCAWNRPSYVGVVSLPTLPEALRSSSEALDDRCCAHRTVIADDEPATAALLSSHGHRTDASTLAAVPNAVRRLLVKRSVVARNSCFWQLVWEDPHVGHRLLLLAPLRMVSDVCVSYVPIAVGSLVKYIGAVPPAPISRGLWLCGMVIASQIAQCIAYQALQAQLTRISMHVSANVKGLVFRKSMRLPQRIRRFAEKELLMVTTVDVGRIADGFPAWHNTFVSVPTSMLWYLYLLNGYVGLAATLTSVCALVTVVRIHATVKKAVSKWKKSFEVNNLERVAAWQEALTHIDDVKTNAWERYFVDKILSARKQEFVKERSIDVFRALLSLLNDSTALVIGPACFGVFYWSGGDMDNVATLLSAVALISSLRSLIWAVPGDLGKLKDAVVSLARVDALLSAEEAPQFICQTRKKDVASSSPAASASPAAVRPHPPDHHHGHHLGRHDHPDIVPLLSVEGSRPTASCSTATVSVASSSLAASPLPHEEEEPGGGGSDGDGIIARYD